MPYFWKYFIINLYKIYKLWKLDQKIKVKNCNRIMYYSQGLSLNKEKVNSVA